MSGVGDGNVKLCTGGREEREIRERRRETTDNC